MVGFRESWQFLRIKNGISSNLVYSDLENIEIFFQDFFDLGASQKKSDKSRFLLKIIRFKIRKKYSAILHRRAVIHHLGLSRQIPWPRRDKTRFSLDTKIFDFGGPDPCRHSQSWGVQATVGGIFAAWPRTVFSGKETVSSCRWRSTKSALENSFFEDFVMTDFSDFSMIFQFSSTLNRFSVR